ncbi:MAG: hypothetical protein EAY75_06310, partial [Bacteroidetes bacterium]
MADNSVNGTGTNVGGTLRAYLVNASGLVVNSDLVLADGRYLIGGAVPNSSYTIRLSTATVADGSPAPAPSLPSGWLNTGESLSTSGSDGSADGILAMPVGTVNITGANFGINSCSVSAASSSPSLCAGTPLAAITHTTTGATGIGTPTGLPAGVTAAWSSNNITISGTPTSSGTFNYSIPLTGGGCNLSATGTITVTGGGTDTDGDLIGDVCDLDDDNDGILDTDEGCGTTVPANQQLNYAFYDGAFTSVTQIPTTGALATGLVSNFDAAALQNSADPGDAGDYGIRYSGFINITTPGSYTFYTTSDDGSTLSINNTQVVANDFLQGATERFGTITLTAGWHSLSVLYFQGGGGRDFSVSYEGPSIAKQALPFSILSSVSPQGNLTIPVSSGLRLHLDASQITGLSNGATVNTWNDVSGNGNNATSSAGTPTYQTNALGGRPVVRFNDAPVFTTANLSAQFPSATTTFIVANINNDNAYNLVQSQSGDQWWRWSGDGLAYPALFRSSRIETYTAMPNSGVQLFTVNSSATNWEMFINGASRGVAAAAYSAGGALTIAGGANSLGANPLNGDIAEVIIYNRVLTAAELDQVGSYLEVKYGLTTSYTGTVGTACLDTDGDGIVNSLDTDSDNDGCPDAIEGGAAFTTANISSGRLTGGVSATGIPLSAGGGQTIGSSQIATTLTVTTAPVNSTVVAPAAASFSIATDARNNTSWSSGTPQYATPGNANTDTRWIDAPTVALGGTQLTNTGVYTNVTTSTLNISNSTGLFGKQYFVVVTQINNECIREVRSATLLQSCTPGPSNPDTDSDGIANSCDLDDDNDGILDTDECTTNNFFWSNPPTVSGNTATGTINGINYTYTSSSPILTTTSLDRQSLIPSIYNVPSNNPTIKNILVTNNTLTFSSPVLNPVLVFTSIGAGVLGPQGVSVPINFSNPVTVVWSSNVVQNSATQITGTEGLAIVQMTGTYSSISFDYTVAEDYANFNFGANFSSPCDTDGDGLIDALDNDSDNDGCPDAREGDENVLASQIDANGRITGGLNANGVPNLVNSGGTADVGGDVGQGIGNSRVATQLNVTTAPVNSTVVAPAAASFSIATDARNNTSWSSGTPQYATPGNANTDTR